MSGALTRTERERLEQGQREAKRAATALRKAGEAAAYAAFRRARDRELAREDEAYYDLMDAEAIEVEATRRARERMWQDRIRAREDEIYVELTSGGSTSEVPDVLGDVAKVAGHVPQFVFEVSDLPLDRFQLILDSSDRLHEVMDFLLRHYDSSARGEAGTSLHISVEVGARGGSDSGPRACACGGASPGNLGGPAEEGVS